MADLRPNTSNIVPWATNAGRTLEPELTLKQTGWDYDQRVPPKQWNYLHNRAYEQALRVFRGSVTTPFQQPDFTGGGAANVYNMIWWDAQECWAGFLTDGKIRVSPDAAQWGTYTTLTTNAPMTAARTRLGQDEDSIIWTGQPGWVYFVDTSGNVVFANTAKTDGFAVAFGYSDTIILWDEGDGATVGPSTVYASKISVSSGAYNTPTTDIGGAASSKLTQMVHIDDARFIAFKDDGTCWLTEDGGDNWAQQSGNIGAHTSCQAAADPGTGVVMVAYVDGSNNVIVQKSTNYGDAWNSASLPVAPATSGQIVSRLYNIADDHFIIVGRFISQQVFGSTDIPVPGFMTNNAGSEWLYPLVPTPTSGAFGAGPMSGVYASSERLVYFDSLGTHYLTGVV